MLFYSHVDRLRFVVSGTLSRIWSQRISKTLVEVKRNDGLGQLVQVTAEYVCSIVDCVAGPIQPFAISVGRIEGGLKVFDALRGATQAENAFYIGRCVRVR